MFVAFAGKDTPEIKSLVDDGFTKVRAPLEPAEFAKALAEFEYHMRSDLQTPTQIADNFGWYSVEGSPAYAPGANGEDGAYFKAAGGLTADFVASVAQKYLGKPPVVVTMHPDDAKIKGKAPAQ
jgi:predicted Zn-dependent peptidase